MTFNLLYPESQCETGKRFRLSCTAHITYFHQLPLFFFTWTTCISILANWPKQLNIKWNLTILRWQVIWHIDCSFSSKSLMYWFPQSYTGCELPSFYLAGLMIIWWLQFIYYTENRKDLILLWELNSSEWNWFWVFEVLFWWGEESVFFGDNSCAAAKIITLQCINQLTCGLME